MTKFQVYKKNIKNTLRAKQQGRWFNNRSVTSYLIWYTYKFILVNIKKSL